MQIGELFPAGGRVEPSQMIGRGAFVDRLTAILREGVHIVVSGERRIGKTTVCNAACARLRADDYLVVEFETPKQSTETGFCQLMIDRCMRIDIERTRAKQGLAAIRPFIEQKLAERGVPLDLSGLGTRMSPATRRAALELPLELAGRHGRPTVLFLDELQRAVDYADGEGLIGDLVDIYSAQHDIVVLIDGSHTRVVDQLMGDPFSVGKLARRMDLSPTIPTAQWRPGLQERFAKADLSIPDEHLDELLAFGAERPYDTMTAAQQVALITRRLSLSAVDGQTLTAGLDEARRHLEEDD